MNVDGIGFDALASLFRTGSTAVFAGAGISRQAGIPLVKEITPGILTTLGINSEDAEILLSKHLPFEAIIQVIRSHADVSEVLQLFSATGPQLNHQLLSRLSRRPEATIPVILTTNFDTLFEQAADYDVITDLGDVLSRPILGRLPKLVKLHGCITAPRELGATISAVANEQAIQSTKKALEWCLLSDRITDLVILGYSFSDKFDINPALKRISTPVRFWIIDHTDNPSPCSRPLNSLPTAHPLHGRLGAVISVNTDSLMSDVWRITQQKEPIAPVDCQLKLDEQLRKWHRTIVASKGETIIPLIAASLLKTGNCYDQSSRYATAALTMLHEAVPPSHSAILHQIIADNSRNLGLYSDAVLNARKAVRMAHKASRLDIKVGALITLGILSEDKAKELDNFSESGTPHPPRKRAMRYYAIAIRMAQDISDHQLEAKALGDLGIAMKNVADTSHRRRAFRIIHQALKIAQREGDQQSVARLYGMLASCMSLLGKKCAGFKLWNHALAISSDLGDDLHVAIWTANMGEDYIGLDNNMAKQHLNNAIEMFSSLQIPRNVKYCSDLLKRIPKENDKETEQDSGGNG